MIKISACIISYNEEEKIEDCLKSLQDVADEIVVLDSLSEDSTKEIAKRFTDKVFDQAFLGHVEQKNLAVSKASNDWIISLDCDERLTPKLRDSILSIKNSLDKADAYKMARRTFYVYRWLNHCWYPDYKIRLFNRNSAKWGGVNPHDRVEVEDGNVITLEGDIHHYSFNSISEHIQTLDNFTEIGAQEIICQGKNVNIWTPWLHSIWTFIRLYIFKRGFLDGYAGLVVSVLSGMHVFVKYNKVLSTKWAKISKEKSN